MLRACKSKWYNWIFDTETGAFARWGATKEDDPKFSIFGPEILDMEVSTICHGPGKPCPWCYKSNTSTGENMSFETFRQILHHMPNNLTQIAFGIGDIDGNPDLYDMMAYSRSRFVIPNITINGYRMNDMHYNRLARLCGAVAVSHYNDDACFDAVEELTGRGIAQVNIHKLLCRETFQDCFRLIDAAAEDPRLKKLNAIVFLLLKPKGKRNRMTPIENLKCYDDLFCYARGKGIAFGMDSCSGPNLLKATEDRDLFDLRTVEPCESTLFSLYINVKGEVFPCSFTEGQPGWEKGIPILEYDSFMGRVWFSSKLGEWRKKLLASSQGPECVGCKFQEGCRSCPEYPVTICRG